MSYASVTVTYWLLAMREVFGKRSATVAELMTTEQLAEATGLPVRTIRLYRQLGAIRPKRVPGAGNRVFYDDEDRKRVLALKGFQQRLRDRVEAELVEYRVGDESRASELVARALVNGSIVMALRDGTVIIRKPLQRMEGS